MRIDKLTVRNMIAARQVDIKLNSPVTLICGSNEAGKSSICQGIKHAFTGQSTRVALKKDYKHLVNDSGSDAAAYTRIEYDNGKQACITLPNGTHELKEQLHSALPLVLDPELFQRYSEDDRRRIILSLSTIKNDMSNIKNKLLERGCDSQKVEMILPFLKSSFDNAQKQATEKTKEARANWKATTGEAYGEIKAESWKVPIQEVNKDARILAEEDLAGIEKELEESNKRLGAMQEEIRNSNRRNSETERLRNMAERIPRIKTKLDADLKLVNDWVEKVEETRKLAMGSSPGNVACKCPECDAELVFNGKELMARGGDLHGDEDAAVKLPEYENTLKMLKNSVANGERDLAAVNAACEQLAVLEKENKSSANPEDIEALNCKVALLRSSRKQAQDTLDQINKNIRLASEAGTKTRKAAEYHADVMQWSSIADALAPNGIPSEILSVTLDPINNRLAKSSTDTGWKQVVINDDMTINYDGRPYGLASASAKWRIDVMIAEAISHVSGIKFFMADEFDLLDMPNRSACLNWLIDLAQKDEIDSVLVFGTLKALPSGLPKEISAHWIESGVLAN